MELNSCATEIRCFLLPRRLPPAFPRCRRRPKPSCATASRWRTFRRPPASPIAAPAPTSSPAYTIYDPLVAWEMDVADRPGKLVPGLATEWKVDDADKTKWRFTLAQGRQIPRRQRVQRRCGGLESRQGAERQGAAIRQAAERAGQDPPALGRKLRQDRRLHGRDHHQDGRLVLPLPDALVPGLEPRAIRKARQGLGQVRQGAVRHRAVQADQAGAARTR